MSDAPPSTLTRRALLGSAASLTTVAPAAGTSGGRTATATPTVLTWNVYLGVDLFRLFRAESTEEARRVAERMLDEVDPDRYRARAEAIAAAVAAADADVLALQEAVLLRAGRPDVDGPPSAVLVDLLSLVGEALADRGRDYEVAAVTTTTDAMFPVETDAGPIDVRLTDRDALLVDAEVETGETVTDTYEAAHSVSLTSDDRTLTLERGYCSAEVRMDGVGFTAVSTHLESTARQVRREQARELLGALPADGPVVVGGDFNSGPGTETATYDRLTAELRDAYAALDRDAGGFTCCRAEDLRSEDSRLDRRIDALLYRGEVRPTGVDRVGHRPEDRAEVEADGETVRIWPSDHAGVVGTFEVTAPSSATETGTPERSAAASSTGETDRPEESPTPSSSPAGTGTPGGPPTVSPSGGERTGGSAGSGSGMGLLAAVVGGLAAGVGVLAAVAVRLRQR